jgi:hypothetical protein
MHTHVTLQQLKAYGLVCCETLNYSYFDIVCRYIEAVDKHHYEV